MPLFDFRCSRCDAVHERLLASGELDDSGTCPDCGSPTARITVSRFGIAGTKPRTSEASLGSTGADFMASPDRFVRAMDTFGEKVGAPLTANEKERAVSRLEEAKK